MRRGCIRAIVLSVALFLALAVGWAFVLPADGGDPAFGLAAFLALLGLGTALALWTAFSERGDIALIEAADRGAPLRDGARGAAVGTLEASSASLLEAPFSGSPCLFYAYRVHRVIVRAGRKQGSHTAVDAFTGEAMAPCAIWTKAGPLRILDAPTPPATWTALRGADALGRARAFLRGASFVDVVRPGNIAETNRLVREQVAASLADADGYRVDRRVSNPGVTGIESPVDIAKWDLEEVAFSPGETVTVVGRYDAARRGFAQDPGSALSDVFLHKGDAATNTARKRAGARFMTGVAVVLAIVQGIVAVMVLRD